MLRCDAKIISEICGPSVLTVSLYCHKICSGCTDTLISACGEVSLGMHDGSGMFSATTEVMANSQLFNAGGGL